MLNCSNSYAQSQTSVVPLRGNQSSDSVVNIDINYIKLANIKMTDGKYYKSLVSEYEKVIGLQKLQINNLDTMLVHNRNQVIKLIDINKDCVNRNKVVTKQRNYLFGSTLLLTILIVLL